MSIIALWACISCGHREGQRGSNRSLATWTRSNSVFMNNIGSFQKKKGDYDFSDNSVMENNAVLGDDGAGDIC